MFVVGWWPSSDSLRELDRGRPHHDRQPQFHGRAGRVLLEYVSVFVKAEWSRASIPPRDLRPISSLYRNSKHGPRLTWALTLIHEGSILDITTDSCLSMSKGGHYEYQKQNNGGIDCQYRLPVCWRCLRWGWRLHMRQPSASQTMPQQPQ